jgi:hypothetical protein
MSKVKWNGKNLLKTIAENEAGATKLYKAIASEARIGEQFFELLAKDEERHEKIYNALLKDFSDKMDLELEQSDAEYVDLLVESNVLFDDELVEKAKKIFTKSQIFDLAEKAERDAVLFVTELQRLYPFNLYVFFISSSICRLIKLPYISYFFITYYCKFVSLYFSLICSIPIS